MMEDLQQFYHSVRKRTVEICRNLEREDFVVQPEPFVSPPKWHLAHTTWFLEEMLLKKHLPNYQVFHSDFAFLFNSYYNTLGERTLRSNRGNLTRPLVDEVMKYRAYVDKHMDMVFEKTPNRKFEELLTVAMHHEQQHQELLITDIKYILGHNPLFPAVGSEILTTEKQSGDSGFHQLPEGLYTIGHQGKGFCFDNELGLHQVFLNDFAISKTYVTNQEFLDFMEDGGYRRFEFWLDDGWAWVNQHKIKAPLYWHHISGEWKHYTLDGLQSVDLSLPVCHISYYEANAFANWKGMRLPTEFEWEAASQGTDWGSRWEWTNSAYLPYPNFQIAEGALGEYNGKFMSSQMVLRGASVATSPKHSRHTYRNFFQPEHRWQFTGIRLAK